MTNKHIDDADVQEYVLQKTNCDIEVIEHIQHCTNCKIKVEQYRLLFDGIKEQGKPIFDFELTELVMEQLYERQQKIPNESLFLYFIISIVVFSVCIVFYLFGSSLLNLILGITPIFIFLIFTTVISLLVFLCIDMYSKHQRQMKSLNSY